MNELGHGGQWQMFLLRRLITWKWKSIILKTSAWPHCAKNRFISLIWAQQYCGQMRRIQGRDSPTSGVTLKGRLSTTPWFKYWRVDMVAQQFSLRTSVVRHLWPGQRNWGWKSRRVVCAGSWSMRLLILGISNGATNNGRIIGDRSSLYGLSYFF